MDVNTQDLKFYYLVDGLPVGPVSQRELVELYRVGKIHRSTPVFHHGMTMWSVLSDLAVLHERIRRDLGRDHLPELPPIREVGFYIGMPGQRVKGPFTAAQVLEMIKTKEVGRKHFVYDDLGADWIPLFTHQQFDQRRQTRMQDAVLPGSVVPLPPFYRIFRKVLGGLAATLALFFFGLFSYRSDRLQCRLGNAQSCHLLGQRSVELQDWNTADIFLARACALSRAGACYDDGLVLKKLGQDENADHFFKQACQASYGPACYELAREKNPSDENFGLLAKACEFGSGPACSHLGHEDLRNKNFQRARGHFKRSCEQKFAAGCNQWGLLLGEEGDRKASQAAFETSCAMKDGHGCAALGQSLYDEGLVTKAEGYLNESCLMDVGAGCSGAANISFLRGDKTLGEHQAEKACELSDAVGCGLLGSYYQQTGQQNEAQRFFQKACALKSALSCYSLGGLLRAQAAPKDLVQNAFAQACQLNHQYCLKK